MFDSDRRLSEQLEEDLKHNLLLVFKHLKITPDSDVNLKQVISALDSIEAESGIFVLADKDNQCLRQFAKKNPEYRYNFEEFRDLISKLSFEESYDYEQSQRYGSSRSLGRRASVLSERLRGCPLPDFSVSSPSINFSRPASPSQSIYSRSFSSSTGRLSPFLRHEKSTPDMDTVSNRPTRAKSFRLSNTNSYRCSTSMGGEPMDMVDEPSFNDRLEGAGFDKNIKNKLGHQVRRANGELNRKLEEAEDTMSKLSSEASQRISRAESELRTTKLELTQKKKTLFDLRSEVRVQVEQIDILEKEKKDLQSDLMDYKKLYFQTKKQLESTKSQKSQIMVTNKSRLEELDETIKNYQASHFEHQDIITRCNMMAKTIANLERDVAIAQSVAKNFDELVQENFQLKENIESLQKSLAETFQPQPQSTSYLDVSQGNRLNTELLGSISLTEENSYGQAQTAGGIFPLRNEATATSRQLKELEKENRYLKRHIDKTWSQWDRVKGDLVDLIHFGFNDAVGVSQQRLGSILLRMDRYRPAKAYPTFKRASIQQILIDDRPALSSNENSTFASPALGHMISPDVNSTIVSGNASSVATPTTLKALISESVAPSILLDHKENSEFSAKSLKDPVPKNNNLKAFTIKADGQSEFTDQFLENLASTPSSLRPSSVSRSVYESCTSVYNSAPEGLDPHFKVNHSSITSTQSYLARRALKKSGPRVIKKVTFSGFYESESKNTTSESDNSSFALSSQLNSPPLPLPNAIEAVSEPPTRPPLENLLKIGEVPSFETITRLNEIALKAYSSSGNSSIRLSTKPAKVTTAPRPKDSKSYVLLIVYAVAACIFTFWSSPTKEPLLLDNSSLRDEEEKEKGNILENVTKHSNSSQSSSSPGYEVRLNQSTEANQGGAPQVNYRDTSNIFLKFWVEMLIMGGAFPSE